MLGNNISLVYGGEGGNDFYTFPRLILPITPQHPKHNPSHQDPALYVQCSLLFCLDRHPGKSRTLLKRCSPSAHAALIGGSSMTQTRMSRAVSTTLTLATQRLLNKPCSSSSNPNTLVDGDASNHPFRSILSPTFFHFEFDILPIGVIIRLR